MAKNKKPAKKKKIVSKTKSDVTHIFSPLDDRILIEQIEVSNKSAGGLYIPDSNDQQSLKGTVVSVGRGHKSTKGHLRPTTVKVGEQVLYGKFAGSEIKIGESEYIILRETDIIGVLEK